MNDSDPGSDPPAPLRRWRRTCWGAVLIGAAHLALLIADGLVDELAPADVAVVLGSKVYPSGVPSPLLVDRLERALSLYREGLVPQVIVSGGLGVEGHEEAEVMAAYLVRRGIPRGRVIEDRRGFTTFDTARNARRIMEARGLTSAVAVSNYYHVPRCKLAFRRAGILQVASARACVRLTPREPWSLAREVAACYWYALRSFED